MNVETIIRQVEKAGIELCLAGDRIAARPKSKLSVDLRELIKENRDEIILYLTTKSPQSELIHMAIESGTHDQGIKLDEKEVAALIPPSDFRDVARCEPEELQAWATALAMRAVRYQGKVPAGWDQVAHCTNCGPVYSFAAGDCLACPWCEIKRAGKWFPVPGNLKANS